MYEEDEPFAWRQVTNPLSHNCGLIEIDLGNDSDVRRGRGSNQVPADLNRAIKTELAMNLTIVTTIFPVIKQRELTLIKKKVNEIRQIKKLATKESLMLKKTSSLCIPELGPVSQQLLPPRCLVKRSSAPATTGRKKAVTFDIN